MSLQRQHLNDLLQKLAQGVEAVFAQWTALRLAVDLGWGGVASEQKAQRLCDDVMGMFAHRGFKRLEKSTRKKADSSTVEEEVDEREFGEVYNDEIEDLLIERLQSDFSTVSEDGSVEQVGMIIAKMWRELQDSETGESEALHSVLGTRSEPLGSAQSTRVDNEADSAVPRLVPVGTTQALSELSIGPAEPGETAPATRGVKREDSSDDDGWSTQRR